ncbi:unnamed protein product, partial [marine sediment metagenome]
TFDLGFSVFRFLVCLLYPFIIIIFIAFPEKPALLFLTGLLKNYYILSQDIKLESQAGLISASAGSVHLS